MLLQTPICFTKHSKVFGADVWRGKGGGSVGRRTALVGGVVKWSVACWTIRIIAEGRICASQDELLRLGISKDNGIVMSARARRSAHNLGLRNLRTV